MIKITKITKNKNAGATQSRYKTREYITFTANITESELLKVYPDAYVKESVEELYQNKVTGSCCGELRYDTELIPHEDIIITHHNEYETINHHPISEYYIQYEDRMYFCDHCSTMMNWKTLYSESCFEALCPKCDNETHIEYVLETLEQYKARTGL